MNPDAAPTPDDEIAAATAYVTESVFPPLPASYGPWLVQLARLARDGTDPAAGVAVPQEVIADGLLPPGATKDDTGALTVSLGQALAALRQEDLLFPDATEDTRGIEVVTPLVALALANSADADTVAEEYNADTVRELAEELADGRWIVYPEQPIRVDEQGRLASGVSRLLAIVVANMPAPVAITYDYDRAVLPLTWRPPTREA